MNNQEIFDKVKAHLLGQGARCTDEVNKCMYRSGSMRCAIGCLITDENYRQSIEGHGIKHGETHKAVFNSIGVFDSGLLVALQDVHDDHSPVDWPAQLKKVAERYDLQCV